MPNPAYVRRGGVVDARLRDAEGHEQQGLRPVVVVSRDAINDSSVVLVVPLTTWRPDKRIYPSQVVIEAGVGGLTNKSVAKCEQVRTLPADWIIGGRGTLPADTMRLISFALMNALSLDP